MRFWWVRHAPTHAKSMVGWNDIAADLSDAPALARLSAFLPKHAAVISSPLQRAVGTAEKVAQGRNILPSDPDLREIHFGDWEGLSFDEANARDPDLLKAFWDKPGDSAAPQGESWNDLSLRVNRAVDRLLRLESEDVIVVAHFGAILCQVQRARRVTTQEIFAQKIDNLSVSCLEYSHEWVAQKVNHTVLHSPS
jgi:broad specificity phosphatase PhoE